MEQKQKLNHFYFMQISLPSRFVETKIELLEPAAAVYQIAGKKIRLIYSKTKLCDFQR